MSNPSDSAKPGLTYEVTPRPTKRLDETNWLAGTIKIGVEIGCNEDYNPGDKLLVSVSDQHGTVLRTVTAEVGDVGFKEIKEKRVVVGVVRVHKADQVDSGS